jgi:hypothetical protein
MDSEPMVIYSAQSAEDAHLLKNILAENGIEAHVMNTGLGAVVGFDSPLAAQVAVAGKDVAEARRIAAEFDEHKPIDTAEAAETTATAARGDWPACPRCGTPRTAICPACRTEGSDFPSADRAPDAEPGDASRPLLLCPECDEPFTPGYLRRCGQCGHPFESAGDVDAAEDLETGALREHFSAWAWVVALISVLVIVAVIILLFVTRR